MKLSKSIAENKYIPSFANSSTGFGIGSNIVNKALLESNAYDQITKLAKNYVKEIEK